MIGPAEHPGQFSHCLFLHLRACASAIESVVVRVDPHGEHVGGAGNRMRRLEHLARILGVEVGIVVLHTRGNVQQHTTQLLAVV